MIKNDLFVVKLGCDQGHLRTDAQLEYIQRLSEVAPEWTETKVAEPGDRGWVSVSCPARSEADTRPQGEEGTVILSCDWCSVTCRNTDL